MVPHKHLLICNKLWNNLRKYFQARLEQARRMVAWSTNTKEMFLNKLYLGLKLNQFKDE
jgi:hypothetical protein